MLKLRFKDTVVEIDTHKDHPNLYNLTNVYKATGDRSCKPANYLRGKRMDKLKEELGDKFQILKIEGKGGYTYAPKEVLFSYADWVSEDFHAAVIQAFTALVEGDLHKAGDIALSVAIDPLIIQKEKELRAMLNEELTLLNDKYAFSNWNRLICKGCTNFTPKELTGGYSSAFKYILEVQHAQAASAFLASLELVVRCLKAGIRDYHTVASILAVKTSRNSVI